MNGLFGFQPQFEEEREILPDPVGESWSGRRFRAGLDLAALEQEEQVRLVQRVFLLPAAKAPHTVVFCGVESGSGATRVCARTAETLASQAKGSVCLVDANVRTPSLHDCYGRKNHRGLTDALLHSHPIRDLVNPVNGGNLWLLSCGSTVPDPYLLFTAERLGACLVELRQQFDFVLVDAPPVNAFADAPLLAKLADGVVLVVQANSTRREAAKNAVERLTAAKVQLLGAVLNKRRFPIPQALYRRF